MAQIIAEAQHAANARLSLRRADSKIHDGRARARLRRGKALSTPRDFEKLGLFYLGRNVSAENGELTDQLTLYDSKDLTTHAVIVGMTGSGKTGLAVTLIEEAALDHSPGHRDRSQRRSRQPDADFPELEPGDFEPWIDAPGCAGGSERGGIRRRNGRKVAEGLAAWGQGRERIGMLREAAETVHLHARQCCAGMPLSVLGTFGAPGQALRSDPDSYRELVANVAANLLGLVGIDADPLTSREHILLSAILEAAWQQGQDLDLGKLIARHTAARLRTDRRDATRFVLSAG